MSIDPDEFPLLNEPNVMLVALKTAERGPALPEDCARHLMASLRRAHRDSAPIEDALRRRVAAAVHYLCVAGLLDPDDAGRCTITARGRRMLREHPTGIDASVLIAFPEFRAYLRRPRSDQAPAAAGARADEPAPEYDEGFLAYRAGRDLTENPHEFDTIAHLEWENGWCEAHDEASD